MLLGANQYGTGIDIWSMGCIFAELMLRTPYLAAETDLGQLKVILKALGTPTEENWPVFFLIFLKFRGLKLYQIIMNYQRIQKLLLNLYSRLQRLMLWIF